MRIMIILFVVVIAFASCTVAEKEITINPDFDIEGWHYWLTFHNTNPEDRYVKFYKRETNKYGAFDLYPGEWDTVWEVSHFKTTIVDYSVFDPHVSYEDELYSGSVELAKEDYTKIVTIE